MKTPYCTALGIRRREVDQVRIAISVAVDTAAILEAQGREIARAIAAEHGVAAGDILLPENAYFARMRSARASVAHERSLADARLEQLRERARDSYGAMKAIEGAADDYRADLTRQRSAAEQAEADDRAAIAIALRRLRDRSRLA